MLVVHRLACEQVRQAHRRRRQLLSIGTLASGILFGVMSGLVSSGAAMAAIVTLCVGQLLLQPVFFLHLGPAPDQCSNTGIFLCTALLMATIVAGSL